MPKSKSDYSINAQHYNTNLLERLRIYTIRRISNYIWKIVDTVAYKNRKIAEIYEKRIGEEYKKEYDKSGILNYNKILHIGCGTYPLTEITLTSLTGKKVVGIDKNPKAVKLAREIIRKKKLDKKVKINHGNGINYPVDEFDVIIVSSCSTPKKKILENIFKQVGKNSIIIIREIDSTIDYILDCINQYDNVTILKKLHFNTNFFIPFYWNSIYVTKKR